MRNFKVTVEYDGSRYSGWQRQGNTKNTIQYKFEEIISVMVGKKCEIFASGRTDSGVHAKGQVFNFKCETQLSAEDVKNYINRYLPDDIRVLDVQEADIRFHARLNVKSKTYCYRLYCGSKCPVFDRKYVFFTDECPNVEAMKLAAKKLIGKHDFKGFSTKSTKKSTIREIYDINVNENDGYIDVVIKGSGFLYNMVRIITGTLFEIGTNKKSIDSIDEILNKKDRAYAGATFPPQGLCLLKVEY